MLNFTKINNENANVRLVIVFTYPQKTNNFAERNSVFLIRETADRKEEKSYRKSSFKSSLSLSGLYVISPL